jgi:hypothetical protein
MSVWTWGPRRSAGFQISRMIQSKRRIQLLRFLSLYLKLIKKLKHAWTILASSSPTNLDCTITLHFTVATNCISTSFQKRYISQSRSTGMFLQWRPRGDGWEGGFTDCGWNLTKKIKEDLKESLLQQKCLQILFWLIRLSLFVVPTHSVSNALCFICGCFCNFQLHFSYIDRFMYIDACTHAHCVYEI